MKNIWWNKSINSIKSQLLLLALIIYYGLIKRFALWYLTKIFWPKNKEAPLEVVVTISVLRYSTKSKPLSTDLKLLIQMNCHFLELIHLFPSKCGIKFRIYNHISKKIFVFLDIYQVPENVKSENAKKQHQLKIYRNYLCTDNLYPHFEILKQKIEGCWTSHLSFVIIDSK